MTEQLARIDVHHQPDGRTVAALSGEIDLSNAEQLEHQLNEAAAHTHSLTIDLTAIEYMDSQGVRVLQHFIDRHIRGTLELTIVATRDSIAGDIISVTRIGDRVPVIRP